MESRKLTSADIDRVRDIEGFPIATDEAIIELSDAPHYTACPNPFIEEFIIENGTPYDETTDDYHREPFASDVSEGKNDPFYNSHTYHTKVPYKAILRYILHYTEPGDIVFDGFCGTGMTGVAAKMCGCMDAESRYVLSQQLEAPQFGERNAILVDLSPAATHIANRYNHGFDLDLLDSEFRTLSAKLETECDWMYRTRHTQSNGPVDLFSDGNSQYGRINYTVWSDSLICPHCSHEFLFWDVAVDRTHKKMHDIFKCPNCGASLKKTDCDLSKQPLIDATTGRVVDIPNQKPVLIVYTVGTTRFEKEPDQEDLAVIQKIQELRIPYWYPTDDVIDGDKTREALNKGLSRVDFFFQKRNLYALSTVWDGASSQMKFIITAFLLRATKMNKVHMHNFLFGGGGWNAGFLTGVIYFPSLSVETSVFELLSDRVNSIRRAFASYPYEGAHSIVSTQSSSSLQNIPSNSVDYVFTDPPFGANLMYSELSYLWECWLGVRTNNTPEAIINKTQGKQLLFYQEAMTACFAEMHRILKPNHWMTVEFHNSKNAVWNAIQTALNRAGFIVADVRTLNKNQGSFNQVKGATQAIKQDLIISAYKPRDSFTRILESGFGTEETAWAFVRQHLENIPVVVEKSGRIEVIDERLAYLLFDRMVAYHVTQGIPVPLDATEFYQGLSEHFINRDDMYFLPDQVTEYDTARMKMDVESVQFALLVTNEKTAIGWLYQLLANEPMTYQQIQPLFMQEVKTVDRYEAMPELADLLAENFLQDDKGRWYVPDTKKEGDIAKLREKSLLREFDGYLKSKGKLKLFRSEAIRVGFSHLWKDKNYQAIVDLANRLPAATIQEDPNLLMYYDISLSRVG